MQQLLGKVEAMVEKQLRPDLAKYYDLLPDSLALIIQMSAAVDGRTYLENIAVKLGASWLIFSISALSTRASDTRSKRASAAPHQQLIVRSTLLICGYVL